MVFLLRSLCMQCSYRSSFVKVLFCFCLNSMFFVFEGNAVGRLEAYFKNSIQIAKSFLKDPTTTSACSATSPWAVDRILQEVLLGNVLEIGAGPGVVTIDLARQLQLQASQSLNEADF